MTKVKIISGACGFVTDIEASGGDDEEITLKAVSGCSHVGKLFETLGESFDGYELCLHKPGSGPLYAYAAEFFPTHCGCPVIAGVVKAVEAECKLALPKDASIQFIE